MRNNKGQFIKGNKSGKQFKIGSIPFNKNTHIINSGSFKKGYKHSKEILQKISKSLKGRVSPRKGVILSNEQKNKMKFFEKGMIPWNKGLGNKTPLRKKIYFSEEYKFFRKSCFERDNFTCQVCKISGGLLRVHHINNFADFPELRTIIDNGITICDTCHRKFHKKYGQRNNTRSQIEEFIIGQNI